MASKITLALVLSLTFLANTAFGEIICEELPIGLCAFSIASSGKRCLVENYAVKRGTVEYQCKTSEVVVENMKELVESDECVNACGVDRKMVGISSDSLLEPQFTARLCSAECFYNCPNIVDLYINLAAGEGVVLPDMCDAQRLDPRRSMFEFMSSGIAAGPASSASAPTSSESYAEAPAPSAV